MCACELNRVQLFGGTLKVLLSVGFSRQEYWSGVPFPPPGDHPNSGIKPGSPALQADSLPTELLEARCSCSLLSPKSKHQVINHIKVLTGCRGSGNILLQ